jgi:Chaperone of endosialidase
MPRNPLGVYSRPPGTDAISNRTISSAAYNANVIDVETDLNLPRPISAGGTGASDAAGAITNLGGPFVKKSGDTMTGALNITATSPNIAFNSTGTSAVNQIEGQRNSLRRWLIQLGDGVAESGGNVGSNFWLYGYNDDGTTAYAVMNVNRATRKVTQYQATDFNGAIAMTSTLNVAGVISGPRHNVGGGPNFPGISAPLLIGYLGGGSQYGFALQPQADSTVAIYFLNASGTGCGNISQTLNTTVYNTSSDARLKESLKTFDAGRIVDDTTVYNFAWKQSAEQIAAGEPPERAYGVVGQEAIEVYPAAVTYLEKEDWWGVDYSKYVPVLLQELKALRARVAALEGTPVPLQQPR